MILWDPASHFCSRWVDDSLEDDSLIFRVDSGNFAQQEVEFAIKFTIFSKWQRRCGRFEIWRKTGSFYFSWVLIFRLFHKLTCVSAVPTTQGGKRLRASQKISTILASWLSSLFKSWRAEFSWDFGKVVLSRWVKKGGNFQNFKSVNKTSKVDAQSDKSISFVFPSYFTILEPIELFLQL